VQTFTAGQELRGEFKEGKIWNGKGDFVFISTGDTRSGKWVDGVMTGYGVITNENFSVYRGEMKDGVKHGKGVVEYATGEVFRGEFKDGKIHSGSGFVKARTGGMSSMGRWVDGKLVGRGTKTMEGLFSYEGGFRDGKYHGEGVLTQKSGEVLRGKFKYGKVFEGRGTRRLQNGTLLRGTWVKGVHTPDPDGTSELSSKECTDADSGELK
jgi:hypothetical protein